MGVGKGEARSRGLRRKEIGYFSEEGKTQIRHLPSVGQALGLRRTLTFFRVILSATQRDRIVIEQLQLLPRRFCQRGPWEAEKPGTFLGPMLLPCLQPQAVSKTARHHTACVLVSCGC